MFHLFYCFFYSIVCCQCGAGQTQCYDSTVCIDDDQFGNGVNDCGNNSDEGKCNHKNKEHLNKCIFRTMLEKFVVCVDLMPFGQGSSNSYIDKHIY